jgi:2-keto-4-pentenoate hydratase/2-oxohepta-3-ene-1,7-dioic acid hydratase in catechol pathway
MKLVTYATDTPSGAIERLGAIDGDRVVDLSAAFVDHELTHRGHGAAVLAPHAVPSSLLELLRLEEIGMEGAATALEHARSSGRWSTPLASVHLRAPLPRPTSLRDFMLVEEHIRGSGLQVPDVWYEMPIYWKGNADAVFGPEDEIRWPAYTEKLDYELELCVIIGKQARGLSVEEAPSAIAGYTIFNDWSARDIQMREMALQLGPGLGKDFATSMGPYLVTPDELDPFAARMEARVNGEVWSSGTLGTMQFTFAEMVSHVSQEQTLMPGDVLGSGTIGRGCGLELDRWIQPGDVVELEVEGIGVLRNRVVK